MIFKDRMEAGSLLAKELSAFANQADAVIVGLARGGVVVAYAIANALHLPLDVSVPRKIGAPNNLEFAIGAVTEDGHSSIDESLVNQLNISKSYLESTIAHETELAKKRKSMFSLKKEILKEGKTVILVDDGLATGSTMKAAIRSAQLAKAKKIIVAIPVAPRDTLIEIKSLVDAVFCLYVPENFFAVGQFYQEFYQVDDEEVINILQNYPDNA